MVVFPPCESFSIFKVHSLLTPSRSMQAVCQGNSLNRRPSPPKKLLRFQEILSLQKTEHRCRPGVQGRREKTRKMSCVWNGILRECGRTARLTVALNVGL